MLPEAPQPAQPIIARFAVTAPTGRQRWRLVELPLDDEACAAEGYNVIGPALDLGVLPEPIRRELWDVAADPDKRERLNNLLGRLPRWTCPGYDVDGDNYSTAEAIAEAIVKAELRRGINLRVSRSSGSQGAGLHLEFGPTTRDAASVDLLHTMLRRAGVVAREAGLAPKPGSAVGHGDVPLTWILPGRGGAVLDLIPLNHGPSSKQRLFRPLGGLNKRGDARKCLALGSPPAGSPITRAILAQAPPAPAQPQRRERERYQQEDWRPVTPVGRLAPLIRALIPLCRPGDNHDLRLALCAVAQVKRLLTREAWINALGQAWGDRADAAAAWDSTAERLRSRLAVRGATWLRARIGTKAVYQLAVAIAAVAEEPISEIFARFGRPTADGDHLDAIDAHVTDTRLNDRAKTARRCLQFRHHAVCTGCDVELYRARVRCGWFEACPACAIAHLRSTESWLVEHWEGRMVYARFTGYSTREEGLDDVARRITPAKTGERPLRLPVPRSDGGWDVLALAAKPSIGAALLRGQWRVAEVVGEIDAPEGVKLAIDAIAQRLIVPVDHLEHGRFAEAAELLEDLYCTHRAVGVQGATLGWPSTTALRIAAREQVDERNENDCCCAADTPECHHYDHLPTGARIVDGARFPQPITMLVSTLDVGQATGLIPPDPPEPPRRRTPLRE